MEHMVKLITALSNISTRSLLQLVLQFAQLSALFRFHQAATLLLVGPMNMKGHLVAVDTRDTDLHCRINKTADEGL